MRHKQDGRPGFLAAALVAAGLVAGVPAAQALELTLAPAIEAGNVLFWPVLAPAGGEQGGYLSLDQGIAAGEVEITEIAGEYAGLANPETGQPAANQMDPGESPEGGQQEVQQAQAQEGSQTEQVQQTSTGPQVGQLLIRNRSGRPLFLMAGEVIKGGRQNRVVRVDTLIPPGSEGVPLEVFCVEQGRWYPLTGNEEPQKFTSGKQLVAQGSLRKTVVGEAGQQAVWDKVAELNAAQGAANETADYTANLAQGELMKRVRPELEAVATRWPQPGEGPVSAPIGVVAAIDGRIYAADLLGDSSLFSDLRDKILTSYLLEALARTPQEGGKERPEAVQPSPPAQTAAELRRLNAEAQRFLQALAAWQLPAEAAGASQTAGASQEAGGTVEIRLPGISGSAFLAGSGSSTVRVHQVFFAEQGR